MSTAELTLRVVALLVGAAMCIVGAVLSRNDTDSIGVPLAIFGGFVIVGAASWEPGAVQ